MEGIEEDIMNEKRRSIIKEAIDDILKEYNILTPEDIKSMDEETGDELYGNLKAGILEEFNLDNDTMGELLDEVLGA